MKAIIPVAGEGTRLRPHTHTTPKALIYVAGKPIIGHILDAVLPLGVAEIILIIGHLGQRVIDYVKESYPSLIARYVEQKDRKGLGHAVLLAKEFFGGESALIVYGDTIFQGDLSDGIEPSADGRIGVKEVEQPERFGVVRLEGDRVVELVEKPEDPISNLAIVGFNYINNTALLFDCLEELMRRGITTRGEYQLTDAFQLMVDKGAILKPFVVKNWFDCGRPEALLRTNRHLLENLGRAGRRTGSILVPPVYVSDSVEVVNSIIGPYVSLADGAQVVGSIVRDSIVGQNAKVDQCLLEGSIIGDNAHVKGVPARLNVGDSSEVGLGSIR
ncbi:MAG TPA: nucleotidyl transferase [Candidatus Latescibacteria bacterium]|nr:nucleotidyl transferase [Candidatus Latescibacterota bacterium]